MTLSFGRLRSSLDGPGGKAVAGDAVRIAVSAEGRRASDSAVVDEAVVAGWPDGVIPVLDHAGPAAALWAVDRPVGPDAVKESLTGRLPRVLDDAGWDAVVDDFARAAALFRARGVRAVVAVDADGLLHACVSPLMSKPPQPGRVVSVVAACAPVDVLCVVEDLAPGGLDATAGTGLCRFLVDAAQAETLYATAGTVRLAPLYARDKGDSVDDKGVFVDSAAWVSDAAARVVAVGAAAAPDTVLLSRAKALELQGILLLT